jgi:glycosyltransferase involved in cell wall biosynthesis
VASVERSHRRAKILEIGPFPPPRAGWAVRIDFVKERIERMGHTCKVLNIGINRKIHSSRYISVRNGFDYVGKVLWHSMRGYDLHVHTNGDVWPTGWALALIAELIALLRFNRAVLTFHAGAEQVYFPRERSGKFFPILYLLFTLPKTIICNNPAVKNRIHQYGIPKEKIVAISAFSQAYLESADVKLPPSVEEFCRTHDPILSTYVFMRDTLIEGLALLRGRWPRLGVVNAGCIDDCNESVLTTAKNRMKELGLFDHFCFAGDLSHDEFLTLLRRSKLYLRTPTTDGDSASVLESLSLGVPVVAAENGNRPASVITYQHDDPLEMFDKVNKVLCDWTTYRDNITKPTLKDTVQEEAELLINGFLDGLKWRRVERIGARKSQPIASQMPDNV